VIVYPESFLVGTDQTGLFQYFEMFRHTGLRNPEGTAQFTDTHDFLLQQFEDYNPVRVGKRFHDLDK
jgi:hypothetical protein